MIRSLIHFAFGACIASPFVAWAVTAPLPRVAEPMQSAIYTAAEDGKVRHAVALAHTIELETVVVVGRVAKSTKRPAPSPKPPSQPACHLRPLEQGGSPSAPFVLECG